MLAAKLGFELRVATPEGFECDETIVANALELAKESGAKITFGNNPNEAVKGCDVVTTDTWVSMGQEDEKEVRMKAFDGYMADKTMMSMRTSNKTTVINYYYGKIAHC